ncbi:MAG: ATP-binding cassette domain-containing protein [Verrucomicrobia bacterium]|nr:ATP-binding cassette domain-containing protein [Verrucomicrobiota bacterium]
MSASQLLIQSLSKRFGDQIVLDAIDLEIPLGKHTTLIGRSGVGKSVFLKCIAGLLEPDAGTIALDDAVTPVPHCSYLFQQNALFDSMTVFDNVAMPLREKEKISRKDLEDRVFTMLEQLDLQDAAHKYQAEISGGMQKRVALARALITKPEIILFDEPTTGLDPERKFSVFEMIRQYRQQFGFTVIMVSHDVPEVFKISDHVAWLDQGKIAYWGTSESLLSDPPSGLTSFINPQLA